MNSQQCNIEENVRLRIIFFIQKKIKITKGKFCKEREVDTFKFGADPVQVPPLTWLQEGQGS